MSQSRWKKYLETGTFGASPAPVLVNALELLRNPFFSYPSVPVQSHIDRLSATRAGDKFGPGHYLPIESFKSPAEDFFRGGSTAARAFRSSGTTSQDKSRSLFSTLGLELYKKGALATFFAVMEAELGLEFWDLRGFSLIPPAQTWNDSSLAQMATWIAEFAPLSFVDGEEFSSAIKSQDTNKPIWVFGTAFHFVNLIDQGLARHLPPGSLLIETGGTKGKSRELNTRDYHRLLCDAFNIEEAKIIGEYGMCELASQAYRFCGSRGAIKGQFRFPSWVIPRVTRGLGHFHSLGCGSLLVHDPLRIDYPWPIRTQDIVEIHTGGGFNLIGRIPGATLKGCSLLAEEIIKAPESISLARLDSAQTKLVPRSIDDAKLINFVARLSDFIDSADLAVALEAEIGCANAAKKILADLGQSLPKNAGEWKRALDRSQAFTVAPGWLFILPNSHPVAGIYPLIFGALGGLRIWVRIPEPFNYPASSVNLWIRFLETSCATTIECLGPEFRIGLVPLDPAAECLLCFGTSETVREVEKLWGKNTVGFGSSIGISILQGSHDEEIALLIDDVLGLGQKGCLSSRCLLIQGQTTTQIEELQDKIFLRARTYWNREFTVGQKTSLDCEESRLIISGAEITPRKSENDILLPRYRVGRGAQIHDYLSSTQFVLPIIELDKDWAGLEGLITPSQSVSITYSKNISKTCQKLLSQFPNMEKRPLGMAHQPPWDGSLQGKPLFLFNNLR